MPMVNAQRRPQSEPRCGVDRYSENTRQLTEDGSQHLNIVSLSPEHGNTQTDRDTKPIIHRSHQGDTRQQRFNVYSCKTHILDSRRARVAAFIGRQKERAGQHATSTHGRQGQSRVCSSTILLSQPSYKIDRNCVWHQGRVGRVHVLAVLKMVRADLGRVVQVLCRFRAKITWPSVYDPFLGPVKT